MFQTIKSRSRERLAFVLSAIMFVASLVSSAPAWAVEASCTPSNVVVFASRVHIRCEETVGGIRFFAAPTSDAAHAARVLSVISTATVAGRTVIIFYDPANTSGSAIGCAASDCRLLDGVGFWR